VQRATTSSRLAFVAVGRISSRRHEEVTPDGAAFDRRRHVADGDGDDRRPEKTRHDGEADLSELGVGLIELAVAPQGPSRLEQMVLDDRPVPIQSKVEWMPVSGSAPTVMAAAIERRRHPDITTSSPRSLMSTSRDGPTTERVHERPGSACPSPTRSGEAGRDASRPDSSTRLTRSVVVECRPIHRHSRRS
jgi:hypothetical protein